MRDRPGEAAVVDAAVAAERALEVAQGRVLACDDLGDPVAALRHAYELLVPGGILVVVEPWSTDRIEDSIDNPVARLDYAISTSLCTPTSLAQPGGHALGTSGGPARRVRLLAEAGFASARVVLDTGQNLVLAATKPE